MRRAAVADLGLPRAARLMDVLALPGMRRCHPRHGRPRVRCLAWLLLGLPLAVAACSRHSTASDSERTDCSWGFDHYEPSLWETEWMHGVTSGERRDRECEFLSTPAEVDRSVRLIIASQDAMLRSKTVPPESVGLYSRMVYSRRCGPERRETGQRRAQLIEPLVGILRDPLTICPRPAGVPDEVFATFGPGESYGQSKRHFLARFAAPWSDTPEDPRSWRVGGFGVPTQSAEPQNRRAQQSILVDMGASTFDAWGGDPSSVGASWFVERYRRRGLSFDWIISYEYEKYDPSVIYSKVPADVLPHYIYYNQGVEKDPKGKWNPWRMLRGIGVGRDDYVVVKLDIDNPDIENGLIGQVMTDSGLQATIDEIFYEHHVNSKPMWPFWRTQGLTLTMADSYREFAFLRSKGVWMHSWP
jgi:hypothetical protein